MTRMPPLLVAALILAGHIQTAAAEKEERTPSVAIFAEDYASLQLDALAAESLRSISETFEWLGRFAPVSLESCRRALKTHADTGEENPYQAAARSVGADLYVAVKFAAAGDGVIAAASIGAVTDRYARLARVVTVRSNLPINIPLKLSREIAAIHRGLPIDALVLEAREDLSVLNAGQWHGLAPGRYRTEGGKTVILRHTSRYRSLAVLPTRAAAGTRIAVIASPPVKRIQRELSERIDFNAQRRYGLEAAGLADPERKFAEAVCIVNPGANILLPGYGAFLATSYLGFKETKPSVPGIVVSLSVFATHFILPEAMGKFKINFFPGVMDSDKTPALNNLQIFLWSTLPLTATAAFFDQLAHQFAINRVLPPFFMRRNEAALFLSAMMPGGGLFYKGWRIPGWCFYTSEMFLAGFCVYRKDARRDLLGAGIALAGVKLAELVTAWFIPSGYGFHAIETETGVSEPKLSMDVRPSVRGDTVFLVGATWAY